MSQPMSDAGPTWASAAWLVTMLRRHCYEKHEEVRRLTALAELGQKLR